MSSSTQSSLERAKAQIPQLGRVLEAERDKFLTVVKEYETHIDSLKRSFENSQQSIIREVENALNVSADNRDDLEKKLQEEKERVLDLTRELDEAQNDDTKVKLESEQLNHDLTKGALTQVEEELSHANRLVETFREYSKTATKRISVLQKDYDTLKDREGGYLKDLDALRQRNTDLEAELELARREPASLQQRLKDAEQKNLDLKAHLQVAKLQASTSENKLKAFSSCVKNFNDGMNSLASSSEQQSNSAQRMSSAPAANEQATVEQRDLGPQTDESLTRPQGLDHQGGNNVSDKEFDLLHCKSVLDQVMDAKNWGSNSYFLKAMDSLTLASRDAKVGPMNLHTMKEKLSEGAYTSVTSFKADFNRILEDAQRLNSPDNHMRIAAERLSKIFDKEFPPPPSQLISGRHCPGAASSAQATGLGKRKANTESLVSEEVHIHKRRSLASLDQSITYVQIVNSGTGGGPGPASPSPDQPRGSPHQPKQIDTCRVSRRITTGKRLGIDATLSSVAQVVNFAESLGTVSGDWKSLLPQEYRLTGHTKPYVVEKRISCLVRDVSKDVIVLRLTPASESDRPEFNLILGHLLQKEKFAAVSHAGIDNVENIDLIPASREAGYPDFFSALDLDHLPPDQTEDMLFMAVVFPVAKDKQREVRRAWTQRIGAVYEHEKDGLASMRNVLARNPLHIFQRSRMLLTSAEHHMARLSELPLSEEIAPPGIRALGQGVARVSYTLCEEDTTPIVDGVRAPRWVFVLGHVVELEKSRGLLVVDVQNDQRPLWLLRCFLDVRSPTRRSITLLAAKFPFSFNDWQRVIPQQLPAVASNDRCLKNTGVILELCRTHA